MIDVAASVRARLSNLSKAQGVPLQRLLQRYVNERIVYRLGESEFRDVFILKGAMLFAIWSDEPHRATKDLDLLGSGAPSEARLRDVFSTILAATVTPPDGLSFDTEKLNVKPIREDKLYGGLRVTTVARLGNARLPVQIDVGFGDAASSEWAQFPSLLELPAGCVRAYSTYSAIAEKTEAMVQLETLNSRMKDFFDIAFLAQRFSFEGSVLTVSLRETFVRRGTPLPLDGGVSLFDRLRVAPEKPAQWSGFARKAMAATDASFGEVLTRVHAFIRQPLAAAAAGESFDRSWPPRGPWS